MFMWIDEQAAIAPGDCATRRIITAASAIPSAAPPWASGMAMPSQPPSAIAA